ncbi:MAG: ChbG/HpnK family deacetylase, partial [Pseudolabrys sp.]
MSTAHRHIWLCADDYGISPGVSAAIRELIARERINATSVMVTSPHFNGEQAGALDTLNSGKKRTAIGLHVTLTAPFSPLSANFAPLRKGRFLSLNDILRAAIARRLHAEVLVIEIAAQL